MDVFHREKKELTDVQRHLINDLKSKAEELHTYFLPTTLSQDPQPPEVGERNRCMALARTNLEQAVMWAVKGITK